VQALLGWAAERPVLTAETQSRTSIDDETAEGI